MQRLIRVLAIAALIFAALTLPYASGAADPEAQTLLAYAAIPAAMAALYLVFRPKGLLRTVALAGGLPGIGILAADAAMILLGGGAPAAAKVATVALLGVSAVSMLAQGVKSTVMQVKTKLNTASS